ncbi:L-lactate dehydrogenase [Wukongibacter baidiensis]|uniref:L-lactate dehydrogenase n=1 Tax=Wukongibacter baidiensis TaxID=1723361 RepID=UPI003D7FED0C
MEKRGNKVVVIGTGFVGSTAAFTLMHSSLISEMVLIDINNKKAEGEAMDLNHGLSFVKPMDIRVGDYSDCKDADIIIMTAGPSMEPGQTRLDLANKNTAIIKSIMENISKYTRDAIILVATNPVDILTYVAAKSVGYEESKIIGSGTVLDSSRFRYLLSKHFNVDARNVHGYIIGEHGDSEVAVWSLANIGGMKLDQYCPICSNAFTSDDKNKIFENVRDAGYHILERKDATYYGVALTIRRITEAILRNENAILTVSSVINGQYGIDDIALSLPTIVNRQGIHKVLELPLEESEVSLLHASAYKLKQILKDLKF